MLKDGIWRPSCPTVVVARNLLSCQRGRVLAVMTRSCKATLCSNCCCRSITTDLTDAAVGTSIVVHTGQSLQLAFATNDTIDGLNADLCAVPTFLYHILGGDSPPRCTSVCMFAMATKQTCAQHKRHVFPLACSQRLSRRAQDVLPDAAARRHRHDGRQDAHVDGDAVIRADAGPGRRLPARRRRQGSLTFPFPWPPSV